MGIDPQLRNWAFPISYTTADMLAFYDAKDAENARARERYAEKRAEEEMNIYAGNLVLVPDLDRMAGSTSPFILDVRATAYKFELTQSQIDGLNRSFEAELAEGERRESIPDIAPANGVELEGLLRTVRWQD